MGAVPIYSPGNIELPASGLTTSISGGAFCRPLDALVMCIFSFIYNLARLSQLKQGWRKLILFIIQQPPYIPLFVQIE